MGMTGWLIYLKRSWLKADLNGRRSPVRQAMRTILRPMKDRLQDMEVLYSMGNIINLPCAKCLCY